jgi:hypothetical protein
VLLMESILFVELAESEDDWAWHSDMTGNKPELKLGCFSVFPCTKLSRSTYIN